MTKDKANCISIKKYTWDVIDSNAYLISLDKHGLLIDTVDSSELLHDLSELMDITAILTHSHFDHIFGLNTIREIFPQTVVISTKKCSDNIGNPYRNMSSSANAYLSFYRGGKMRNTIIKPFVCAPSDVVFENDLEFVWNDICIKLKACYGHSSDSLVALVDDKWLFSGDTILPVPTITRFIGGSTRRFWDEDIPYLEALLDTVEVVFPGHGEKGHLRDMMMANGME